MLGHLRTSTAWRRVFAAIAVLALAMKLLTPPGYMPGTSLAQPIVLCPAQDGMAMSHEAMAPTATSGMSMAMHHGDGHGPSKAPHDNSEHSCAFAGLAGAPLAAGFDNPVPAPIIAAATHAVATGHTATPGRGMAAPPPPSHAPPLFGA